MTLVEAQQIVDNIECCWTELIFGPQYAGDEAVATLDGQYSLLELRAIVELMSHENETL